MDNTDQDSTLPAANEEEYTSIAINYPMYDIDVDEEYDALRSIN